MKGCADPGEKSPKWELFGLGYAKELNYFTLSLKEKVSEFDFASNTWIRHAASSPEKVNTSFAL